MRTSTFAFLFMIIGLSLNTEAQTWKSVTKLGAEHRSDNDRFGRSIKIHGNYMIVGVPNDDEDTTGTNEMDRAGSAYIFEKDINGEWKRVQKLVSSDRAINDFFGEYVSISGNYAVLTAAFDDEDENDRNFLSFSGSAYIFERNANGSWNEVQKIVASDREAGAGFGSSIDISGDYLVVGNTNEEDDENGENAQSFAGAAYVFEKQSNGQWLEVQKVVAADRASNDRFGHAVSIENNRLVISAFTEQEDSEGNNSLSGAGSVYIFERNLNGVWEQVQKIVPSDREPADFFGSDVAVSGDYLVVGAQYEKDDIDGKNKLTAAGSAYIFEKNGSGRWIEVQKIVPSDRAANDVFGQSVALDSNYLIIGATFEDDDVKGENYIQGAGSAYLFKRDETGKWSQLQKIVAPDRGSSEDNFGRVVAISGGTVVIGAPNEDEDELGENTLRNSGSVYVFESSTSPTMIQTPSAPVALVYPNPSTQSVTIELSKVHNQLSVVVKNIQGKDLKEYSFQSTQLIKLDLPDQSGVYLVELNSEDSSKAIIRVLKH